MNLDDAPAADVPWLSVRDLRVVLDGAVVLDGVSFDVARGESVAVLGASGAGKTTLALALMGLLPAGAVVSGSMRLDDVELVGAPEREWQAVRGGRVAMVSQDAGGWLHPLRRIGPQLAEVDPDRHGTPALWSIPSPARGVLYCLRRWSTSDERVRSMLRSVELLDVRRVERAYPHELSGGMCQRVAIAMALAGSPDLLIADEPTASLDVTVQAQIVDLLRELRRSLVLVTHDLAMARELADRAVVLEHGRVVDVGMTPDVLPRRAVEPWVRRPRPASVVPPGLGSGSSGEADASEPSGAMTPHAPTPVLVGRGLQRSYLRVEAVRGVDIELHGGEILGLVGESGSGKTTLGRLLLGLEDRDDGTVAFGGADPGTTAKGEWRRLRRHLQIVMQDSYASLDPRLSVHELVAEPLRLHGMWRSPGAGRRHHAAGELRVRSMLGQVGLDGALHERRPHQLSGGQRQRVAIARALVLEPAVIVLDEPVASLDPGARDGVLELLSNLRDQGSVAYLFISHDLDAVARLCDRIAVMQDGQIVEAGPTEVMATNPVHPYAQRLLAAARRFAPNSIVQSWPDDGPWP